MSTYCNYWNKVSLVKSKIKQSKKIDSIGIGLASPEEIRRWGERRLPNGTLIGKVDKDHTVDYESLKPIEGGLFCERIFGPVEDFYCSCERKGEKNEKFCPNCEVEFTKSRVRRVRMGYIPLAVPVVHVWYLRGRPSYVANLVGKSRNSIDRLAYGETLCESFIGSSSLKSIHKKEEQDDRFLRNGASNLISLMPNQDFSIRSTSFEYSSNFVTNKSVHPISDSINYFSLCNNLFTLRPVRKKEYKEWVSCLLHKPLGYTLSPQEYKNSWQAKDVVINEVNKFAKQRKLKSGLISRQLLSEPFLLLTPSESIPLYPEALLTPTCFASEGRYRKEARRGLLSFGHKSKICNSWVSSKPISSKASELEITNKPLQEQLPNSNFDNLLFRRSKKMKSNYTFYEKNSVNKVTTLTKYSFSHTVVTSTGCKRNMYRSHSGFLPTVPLAKIIQHDESVKQTYFSKPVVVSNIPKLNTVSFLSQKAWPLHTQLRKPLLASRPKEGMDSEGVRSKKGLRSKALYDLMSQKLSFPIDNKYEEVSRSSLLGKRGQINIPNNQIFGQKQKYIKFHTLPLFSTFVYKEWSHRFSFLEYFIWSARNNDLELPFYVYRNSRSEKSCESIRKRSTNLIKNKFSSRFSKKSNLSLTSSRLLNDSNKILIKGTQKLLQILQSKALKNLYSFAKINYPFVVEAQEAQLRSLFNSKESPTLRYSINYNAKATATFANFAYPAITNQRVVRSQKKPIVCLPLLVWHGIANKKPLVCRAPEQNFYPFRVYTPFAYPASYAFLPSDRTQAPSCFAYPASQAPSGYAKQEGVRYAQQEGLALPLLASRTQPTMLSFLRTGRKPLFASFLYRYTQRVKKQVGVSNASEYNGKASEAGVAMKWMYVKNKKLGISLRPRGAQIANEQSLKVSSMFNTMQQNSESTPLNKMDTQQFPRLTELLNSTGGSALRNLLSRFDLIVLSKFLRHELKNLELKVNNLLSLKMLTYSQGLLLGKLAKRRSKQIRRLKLLELFQSQKSNPEWMILSVIPVLPPDLRPILRVNDDFVVASDLNRLYQTVLRRNNTIHERLDDPLPCPESGLFRQRSLQKAVDGLLENGKGGGTPLCASKRRPLVSLSHVLKGKKGLFRQHLLGKRVDYSGRSVIVVGPRLQVHECGLPKEMAIELFQPFLLHRLKVKGLATSNTTARQIIQQGDPVIWHILKQLVYEHPVLLNRAPTLHRLGIQAFQPRLVSGRAILLHPLVCNGFNADFDGDQMAVHVPLSFQARAEAWKIMWSKNNFLSPATGQPILVPSQDMVLGCYYLSVSIPRILDANVIGNSVPVCSANPSQLLTPLPCKARRGMEYKPFQGLRPVRRKECVDGWGYATIKQSFENGNTKDEVNKFAKGASNKETFGLLRTSNKFPVKQSTFLNANKGYYFSNLQDSLLAYFQGRLQTHTPFWVRIDPVSLLTNNIQPHTLEFTSRSQLCKALYSRFAYRGETNGLRPVQRKESKQRLLLLASQHLTPKDEPATNSVKVSNYGVRTRGFAYPASQTLLALRPKEGSEQPVINEELSKEVNLSTSIKKFAKLNEAHQLVNRPNIDVLKLTVLQPLSGSSRKICQTLFQTKSRNHFQIRVEANESLESPLELRLSIDGNLANILTMFQNHYNYSATWVKQCKEESIKYMRTTAGRVVINKAVFKDF